MRYLRIFFLHLQRSFVHRGQTFIYIGMSIMNPLTMIYLWKGAFIYTDHVGSFSLSDLNTYFLTLVLLNNLVTMHVEEGLSRADIQQGGLLGHILKPMSYYWQTFFGEISFRVSQAIIAIIALFGVMYMLHITYVQPSLVSSVEFVVLVGVALFISFSYKFLIGLLAFWITDIMGLFNTLIVSELILGGFVMPINLYPEWLQALSHITPFPYMYYYPAQAITGKLSLSEFGHVLALQISILTALFLLVQYTWRSGLKKFSAVGQ